MHIFSHFNTALQLVKEYNGGLPLHHYLKQYFSLHKKHGSKDRKVIAHFCYCYYRLGYALQQIPAEEKMRAAVFLCSSNPEAYSALFSKEWLSNCSVEFEKRLAFIHQQYASFDETKIFNLQHELSDGIAEKQFSLSHLQQPSLFIRARPGYENIVQQKLIDKNIFFKTIGTNCFELNNSTKLEEIIQLNKEAAVQDYSSQQTALFMQTVQAAFANKKEAIKVWDCCAASGGKSILAKDSFKKIALTVSDIRTSIISNLEKRLKEASIHLYQSFNTDISKPLDEFAATIVKDGFDCIICDAPCSGSGTWRRTPEQLVFFDKEKIENYTLLQKNIVANAIQYLLKGGYFLYLTCSVFKKENEGVSAFIQQQLQLQLVQQQVLKGYDKNADTMFAALFKK